MKKELSICQLNASPGEKASGFINILDTNTKIPLTVINGQKDGKTILITAGIHGCEYPGIKTAIDLAKQINPKEVRGNIIIVHIANTQGFESRKATLVPEDNKNILRLFPGNKEGTLSEKIAYFITNELMDLSDYYFDLHGGGLHETLIPHIYYPAKANKQVVDKCIELAKNFNVDYYAASNNTNGTFTYAAINKNIPSLLIERGGAGLCEHEDVNDYKNDILNILSVLDIIDCDLKVKREVPKRIVESEYLDSNQDGCWNCYVKSGQTISKGTKLGEISDYFGNIKETYYAKFDGVVLYNTVAFSVSKNDSLVAYGRI